MEILIEYI